MTAISRNLDNVVVLKLTGECSDPASVKSMKTILGQHIMDGRSRIIVNMSDVSHIGYLGLGTLVERLRQARSRGGDVRLCLQSSYVRKMFDVVGASNVFRTYDSEWDALESFGVAGAV